MADVANLAECFVHLGLGAIAVPQPPFGGIAWYEDYGARHGGDGVEGRLVSMHSFSESWDSWEMHPAGDEVVICTEGTILLTQEFPGGQVETVSIGPGEFAINPRGVWHTADLDAPATAIFITAGEGTQHRARAV